MILNLRFKKTCDKIVYGGFETMKEQALEVLKNRRAIRKFKPEQIKDEELNLVLEAGTYAPTGMGLQSPLIVAVQDPKDVAKMNELSAKIMGREGLPYYGAPTIIIIFATDIARNEFLGTLDAAAVCTNMLNAAYAVGLGSVWIHRSYEIFESEEGKKLLKKWGITEHVRGVASIALGYSDMPQPTPKPRREGYVKIVK